MKRLQSLLGDLDYEQIITTAIDLLYQENITKFEDQLLPDKEDNYFLQSLKFNRMHWIL